MSSLKTSDKGYQDAGSHRYFAKMSGAIGAILIPSVVEMYVLAPGKSKMCPLELETTRLRYGVVFKGIEFVRHCRMNIIT